MEDLLRFLLRPTIALLLSPLGLVLISATRLLIVADDRPVTATAIASSGGYFNTLLGTLIPLVPIFIPYVALVFLFFRRFLISAIAFLAAAFISPAQIHTTKPLTSYTGTDMWHAMLNWINMHTLETSALAFVLFWVLISWLRNNWSQYEWFSLFWIIGAAVILLPIITPIYPVPRAVSFYVATLRQPWLAPEKITLISGQVDYGYTLTTNDNWFEVLTAGSRTIRYIPASEVASRVVCQQTEVSFSPLIPLPVTTSAQISSCLDRDGPPPPPVGTPIPRTGPVSYLSHGESLNVISSSTHVSPEAILSETNAYQHQRLSVALRLYEICGNWNAPTPYGQRFWYYPPTIP
jgi:hypothetical protein